MVLKSLGAEDSGESMSVDSLLSSARPQRPDNFDSGTGESILLVVGD